MIGTVSSFVAYTRVTSLGTFTFTDTGALQTMDVPAGATSVFVQAWGAGGGAKGTGNLAVNGCFPGGGGGFTSARIACNSTQKLGIVVGKPGVSSAPGATLGSTYGGGGGNSSLGGDQNWRSCSGGGRSALQIRGFLTTMVYDDVVTAGGGGGGGVLSNAYNPSTNASGGFGGGATGGTAGGTSGGTFGGKGGSQTAGGAVGTGGVGDGGTSGAKYQGGQGSTFGCGAGGGYFGGGGGDALNGGGGGSGFIAEALVADATKSVIAQGTELVANKDGVPALYTNKIGHGGPANTTNAANNVGQSGKPGLVVLTFYSS